MAAATRRTPRAGRTESTKAARWATRGRSNTRPLVAHQLPFTLPIRITFVGYETKIYTIRKQSCMYSKLQLVHISSAIQ